MFEKYKPRIISTNIKTRRLGYIIALIDLIGNNFLFLDDVLRRLEFWAKKKQKELERYFGRTGLITESPKHYPARRYIHLAENLRLVKISRNECALTKIGQPLLYLAKSPQNPFHLTDEQVCYLLKRILENDFDYFLPLLKLLKKFNKTKEIFLNFKKAVLNHLEIKSEKIKDILKSSDIKERKNQILRWTQEKKYLEHIIYPRLDWMIDLRILNAHKYRRRIYEFTEEGANFLKEMERMEVKDLDKWLEEHFYKIFGRSFIKGKKIPFIMLNNRERFKYISNFLEDSFRKFSSPSLPLQHMSANTFLEYTCTKLVVMGILPSFDQLKDTLKQMPGYRLQWQPAMQDGFIIKI